MSATEDPKPSNPIDHDAELDRLIAEWMLEFEDDRRVAPAPAPRRKP